MNTKNIQQKMIDTSSIIAADTLCVKQKNQLPITGRFIAQQPRKKQKNFLKLGSFCYVYYSVSLFRAHQFRYTSEDGGK